MERSSTRGSACRPAAWTAIPLDDARRVWKSPVQAVGVLEIPPQDAAVGVALGDRLTFSPWNCLAAHEPLGSINGLRRAAYAASAANRGAEAVPPTSAWPDASIGAGGEGE